MTDELLAPPEGLGETVTEVEVLGKPAGVLVSVVCVEELLALVVWLSALTELEARDPDEELCIEGLCMVAVVPELLVIVLGLVLGLLLGTLLEDRPGLVVGAEEEANVLAVWLSAEDDEVGWLEAPDDDGPDVELNAALEIVEVLE